MELFNRREELHSSNLPNPVGVLKAGARPSR